MTLKPCQKGVECVWGKSAGDKIACLFARCVMVDDPDPDKERRDLERMMSSRDTYDKRGGKVQQRRHRW